MATETLNLNLNEANPPEDSPTETLNLSPTADQDLPQDPSAPPPSSAVNGDEKEVDGSKGRDGAVSVVPVAGKVALDSDVQKKIRRAERFGMPVQLSEAEKRNSRAERFGTASTKRGSDKLKKSEVSEETKKAEEQKRKARAERFGLPVPSEPTEEEAKKKARLARFAPPPKTDAVEEDKRKARALRFSEAAPTSLPKLNGNGDVEPKAAIVGKATGGA